MILCQCNMLDHIKWNRKKEKHRIIIWIIPFAMNLTAFQKLIRWLRNYRHFLTYRTFSMTKMKNPSIRVSIHTIITSIIQAKGFAISCQYCRYIEKLLERRRVLRIRTWPYTSFKITIGQSCRFYFYLKYTFANLVTFFYRENEGLNFEKHSNELFSEELFIILKITSTVGRNVYTSNSAIQKIIQLSSTKYIFRISFLSQKFWLILL